MAYTFAHALMQEIINELSRMLEGILAYKEMLGQILKEVALEADSKCNEQTDADQQQNDRKYDPERVHGMNFGGWDVKFRVKDGVLTVLSLAETEHQ